MVEEANVCTIYNRRLYSTLRLLLALTSPALSRPWYPSPPSPFDVHHVEVRYVIMNNSLCPPCHLSPRSPSFETSSECRGEHIDVYKTLLPRPRTPYTHTTHTYTSVGHRSPHPLPLLSSCIRLCPSFFFPRLLYFRFLFVHSLQKYSFAVQFILNLVEHLIALRNPPLFPAGDRTANYRRSLIPP